MVLAVEIDGPGLAVVARHVDEVVVGSSPHSVGAGSGLDGIPKSAVNTAIASAMSIIPSSFPSQASMQATFGGND